MIATQRQLQFLSAGLFFFLFLLGKQPGRVQAQDNKPSFHSSADYTYGQTMRFRLTVDNAEQVETVELFFGSPDSPVTYSVDVPFEPGERFELVHPVDLSQLQLAPFTTVTYWWTVTLEDGQEITLAKETLAYNDDRFAWRPLSENGHTVYWTGDDGNIGKVAIETIQNSLEQLRTIFSVRDRLRLRLYIYPSSADLRAALRLTGRDLVNGHADPELGVLLVTAVNPRSAATDLPRSIPHELAHFLLYEQVGSAYASTPLWFKEGLATMSEPKLDPRDEARLQDALEEETTIPFSDLCERFPESEERALLARAQSGSLVQFIGERYGNHQLSALIRAYGQGEACSSGVESVLGISLEELEQDWLRDRQPNLPLMDRLYENGVPLLLLAGGFGVARLLMLKPGGRKAE